jgi:WD40 repeat protein
VVLRTSLTTLSLARVELPGTSRGKQFHYYFGLEIIVMITFTTRSEFGLHNHNTTTSIFLKLLGTQHIDCVGQPTLAHQQPYGTNLAIGPNLVGRPATYTSRSVSWNSAGSSLAVASSCATVRIFSIDTATTSHTAGSNASNTISTGGTATTNHLSAKEVLTITGHTAPLKKVRFHPIDPNLLCSAAADSTVQIWDVRNASQRSVGKVEVYNGSYARAVEWSTVTANPNLLQVTEHDNTIYIYDVKKLSSPLNRSAVGGSQTSVNRNAQNNVHNNASFLSFYLKSRRIDNCLFTPDGSHLITGSTYRGEGIGELTLIPLQGKMLNDVEAPTHPDSERHLISVSRSIKDSTLDNSATNSRSKGMMSTRSYNAHAGPIYAMAFSPSGEFLATGGSDATVCVWDVKTMCCIKAITRRSKFIRSLAFSPNNEILAIATEEDTIDLAHIPTGELIGLAPFTTTSTTSNNNPNSLNPTNMLRSTRSTEGAEEVTFHPKDRCLLACARTDTGPMHTAPVTILKLNILTS